LLKKGAKGPTAGIWRSRYFRLEEGYKLAYYKTKVEDIPQRLGPQGYVSAVITISHLYYIMHFSIRFIDIDKITTVLIPPATQQDKNSGIFHLVTPNRTYELQAIDESAMKR